MRKYLAQAPAAVGGDPLFVTFIIYVLMLHAQLLREMAWAALCQAPGSKPYEEWLAQLSTGLVWTWASSPAFVQLKNLCTGNFGDS